MFSLLCTKADTSLFPQGFNLCQQLLSISYVKGTKVNGLGELSYSIFKLLKGLESYLFWILLDACSLRGHLY